MRASQSEAKVKLVTLFTFQKVYFAEHGSYTPCLENSELGTQKSDRYAIGFSGSMAEGFNCEKTADIPQALQGEVTDVIKLLTDYSGLQKDQFKLVAVGRLCPAHECVLDVWTIDQDKKMEQIQDGKRKSYPYRTMIGLVLFFLIPILIIIRKIIMRSSKPKVEAPVFTK